MKIKDIIRFFNSVDETKSCWVWKGQKNQQGYGRFYLEHHRVLAHRFCFELLRQDIPNGLILDHLCRNPSCVNPYHLEIVTYKENSLRGLTGKINHRNTRKKYCSRGHLLQEPNLELYELKRGRRSCKICKNKILATKYRRKKGILTRKEWLDQRFHRKVF